MKKVVSFLKLVFSNTDPKPIPPKPHQHKWVTQYRTGNAFDGKSEVCKCDCGEWAVRHYGQATFNIIK